MFNMDPCFVDTTLSLPSLQFSICSLNIFEYICTFSELSKFELKHFLGLKMIQISDAIRNYALE